MEITLSAFLFWCEIIVRNVEKSIVKSENKFINLQTQLCFSLSIVLSPWLPLILMKLTGHYVAFATQRKMKH